MGIDKELEKQGYEFDDCEAPAEIWINKTSSLGVRLEWFMLEGDIMSVETERRELVLLGQMNTEELTKILVDLIRDNQQLHKAILEVVWSCPNIVTRI